MHTATAFNVFLLHKVIPVEIMLRMRVIDKLHDYPHECRIKISSENVSISACV